MKGILKTNSQPSQTHKAKKRVLFDLLEGGVSGGIPTPNTKEPSRVNSINSAARIRRRERNAKRYKPPLLPKLKSLDGIPAPEKAKIMPTPKPRKSLTTRIESANVHTNVKSLAKEPSRVNSINSAARIRRRERNAKRYKPPLLPRPVSDGLPQSPYTVDGHRGENEAISFLDKRIHHGTKSSDFRTAFKTREYSSKDQQQLMSWKQFHKEKFESCSRVDASDMKLLYAHEKLKNIRLAPRTQQRSSKKTSTCCII